MALHVIFYAVPDKRPEDANYKLDVLTRCAVNKGDMKQSTKIIPLNERGESIVVSLPLSQVTDTFFIQSSLGHLLKLSFKLYGNITVHGYSSSAGLVLK